MFRHDEAVLLQRAVRTAEAVCAQLEQLAPGGGSFLMLLEVARAHREALVALHERAGERLLAGEHPLAQADVLLADLHDVAAAAAEELLELACPGRECDGRRRRGPGATARAGRGSSRPRRRRE